MEKIKPIRTCRRCKKSYDEKEVERIYGWYSGVSLMGYCCAQCHTQVTITETKEGK